jgi:hypothetical protein
MDEAKARPLYLGGVTIDDLIKLHLLNCDQCIEATRKSGPARLGGTGDRLGQKTGLCDTYLQLQLDRANYEGKINNIVAHTEHGDEAPKLGQLE